MKFISRAVQRRLASWSPASNAAGTRRQEIIRSSPAPITISFRLRYRRLKMGGGRGHRLASWCSRAEPPLSTRMPPQARSSPSGRSATLPHGHRPSLCPEYGQQISQLAESSVNSWRAVPSAASFVAYMNDGFSTSRARHKPSAWRRRLVGPNYGAGTKRVKNGM